MQKPNVTEFCDGLKLNRFHWSLLILGTLSLLFDGYDGQLLAYVMPYMLKEWHLTPVVGGWVQTCGLVGLMIGTAGMGMLADLIGRKIPLILCLAIFSVFNGGLYWVHDFNTFCLLRFLAGVGMGGVLVLTITIASEFAPAKIRARMVGIMFVGFAMGPVTVGLCSMLFIPLYGWRIVLFFALLPVLLIPFLWALLPESVRFLVQKGRYDKAVKVLRRMEKAAHVAPIEWTEENLTLPVERKASVRQLFTPKLAVMTILIWLTYFLALFNGYILTTWMPTLLTKTGLSLYKSYSYTVVSNAGAALGAVFMGFLLDRLGRKAGLIVGCLGAALVAWLFSLAAGTPWALYLLAAGVGVFFSGSNSALHAITAEVYPTSVRSTGVGWALTTGRCGAVFGPVFGGLILLLGYSFQQVFGLIAVPPLICAVLVLFYRINVKGRVWRPSRRR